MTKLTSGHYELFAELLVLFMAGYSLFGANLAQFGVPALMVQILAGAYLVIKYLLPQLPAAFQVNKAEADLQAKLEAVAGTVTALQVNHGAQIAQIATQLAQLVPQQTQTTSSTTSTTAVSAPAAPASTLTTSGGNA